MSVLSSGLTRNSVYTLSSEQAHTRIESVTKFLHYAPAEPNQAENALEVVKLGNHKLAQDY